MWGGDKTMELLPIKVSIWGAPKTGKTQLLNQLMEMKLKRLSSLCWEDETRSKFCFLTVPPSVEDLEFLTLYGKDAKIILYLIDLSRPETWERVENILNLLKEINPEHKPILVANKFDLGADNFEKLRREEWTKKFLKVVPCVATDRQKVAELLALLFKIV